MTLPFENPLTFEVTRWRPGRKRGVKTGNRDADGRFAPGNSGEPKGTRHKAKAALALLKAREVTG